MPLTQLRIVKKIKFLVSSRTSSKKQILDYVEKDAEEHRIVNQTQEREDDAKVDHAVKELQDENRMEDRAYARLLNMLVISILINFIFLAAFTLVWYFIFYR